MTFEEMFLDAPHYGAEYIEALRKSNQMNRNQ